MAMAPDKKSLWCLGNLTSNTREEKKKKLQGLAKQSRVLSSAHYIKSEYDLGKSFGLVQQSYFREAKTFLTATLHLHLKR